MARTMTIDLGADLREFVESLVAAGDYRRQSEVVRDSLRLLRERQAASQLEKLRELVRQGVESGEPVPFDGEAILSRVKARAGVYNQDVMDNTQR